MFIQIFTKTIQSSADTYYLEHTHFLDNVELERKHLVWQTENRLIAELCNIGFAMKENIEQDRKLGGIVHREFNFISIYKGMKSDSAKTWTEYKSGIRRNVTVYTENEELYNDIKSGFIIASSYETKLFLRILKLKKDFGIGIGCLTVEQITDDLRRHWSKQYK